MDFAKNKADSQKLQVVVVKMNKFRFGSKEKIGLIFGINKFKKRENKRKQEKTKENKREWVVFTEFQQRILGFVKTPQSLWLKN